MLTFGCLLTKAKREEEQPVAKVKKYKGGEKAKGGAAKAAAEPDKAKGALKEEQAKDGSRKPSTGEGNGQKPADLERAGASANKAGEKVEGKKEPEKPAVVKRARRKFVAPAQKCRDSDEDSPDDRDPFALFHKPKTSDLSEPRQIPPQTALHM